MKHISALIQEGSKQLSLCGVDSPYLDSEIIMQHVLSVERSFIIINHANQVPIDKESLFWSLIKKKNGKISNITNNRHS